MTDLERDLVAALERSADLLEEWIGEGGVPATLEQTGGSVVGALRYLSSVVDLAGRHT